MLTGLQFLAQPAFWVRGKSRGFLRASTAGPDVQVRRLEAEPSAGRFPIQKARAPDVGRPDCSWCSSRDWTLLLWGKKNSPSGRQRDPPRMRQRALPVSLKNNSPAFKWEEIDDFKTIYYQKGVEFYTGVNASYTESKYTPTSKFTVPIF